MKVLLQILPTDHPNFQLLQSPAMTSDSPAAENSHRESSTGWPARVDLVIHARGNSLAAVCVFAGFVWRIWLAHATFLNTDEAWHFTVANQTSLSAAYKASLTLAHPPLLILTLYFWRQLGTSDLMLRLPGVMAGTLFCWVFYKWLLRIVGEAAAFTGLVFACFLPPMVALSAELRQYSLMLLFAVSAAYFLECALAEKSSKLMLASCGCLYMAMLSHYSAFLFAAALGLYAIVRLSGSRPGVAVTAIWASGQVLGVALAAFLYKTHISKLGSIYPVQPLQRFGDFYLSDWYFHPGRDHLLRFLYRGTFGVFRFIFGQTGVGQIAALLFLGAVVLLALSKVKLPSGISSRVVTIFLLAPFLVNWIAVVSGLYPYGRTRQCMFLAIFALTGVSVALARLDNNAISPAMVLALMGVIICHLFGTLQGRDMLPMSEQRHEHMDLMVESLRKNVGTADLIFTDQATSFQLRHYLCNQKPVIIERSSSGLETFRCEGFHVIFTGPNDGALTAQALEERWLSSDGRVDQSPADHVWVLQGGWASGLGEELRRSSEFAHLEVHSFGRFLEVFELPQGAPCPPQG